jgi:hypothetical protein
MQTPFEAQVARVAAQVPTVDVNFVREVVTAMGNEAFDIDVVNAIEEHMSEMD